MYKSVANKITMSLRNCSVSFRVNEILRIKRDRLNETLLRYDTLLVHLVFVGGFIKQAEVFSVIVIVELGSFWVRLGSFWVRFG